MGMVTLLLWKMYDSTLLLGDSQPSQNNFARTAVDLLMVMPEVYFLLSWVGSLPSVV